MTSCRNFATLALRGLIGINEGIEELILTLLIGIKADLLQFIL